MFGKRILVPLALAVTIMVAPASAQDTKDAASAPAGQSDAQKAAAKAAAEAAAKKAAAEKAAAEKAAALAFEGAFQSEILAGGAVNDFRVPQLPTQLELVDMTIKWLPTGYEGPNKICEKRDDTSHDISVRSKAPERRASDNSIVGTTFGIWIAPPPCLWPLKQNAEITIYGRVGDNPHRLIFTGTLPISGFWFPISFTILILALVYPGGAAASWYVSQQRYKKERAAAAKPDEVPKPATFLTALDPVELTKNPYGRGSIAKLQIFVFSFIVFGLLLFNVLRTGLLANMSSDVLYLMGISAAGAAGGKFAYLARRRLSLENWAWLRRKKWLPPDGDIAKRATWNDLFVDSGTKEFDPYRFQMAVFSIVVAIALVKTSATSLEAFQIPTTLLTLLGISQTVFVGSQALDKGGYEELDKKLDDIRKHEKKYFDLKAGVEAAKARAAAQGQPYPPPVDKDGRTPSGELASTLPKPEDVTVELNAFQADVAQAANMFWAIYGQQLTDMSPELKNASTMEPKLT